jgi:hypothetical protein
VDPSASKLIMTRSVDARYIDPLDHIWLTAAAELGLQVRRSPLGYATTDGRGGLSIAPAPDLDADDCLAQIILHEICHALVQGEDSFGRPDWGLANDAQSVQYQGDTVREQACLRVQAALLRRYGLRRLLGPTTDFRRFYDALPRDPLAALPAATLAELTGAAPRSGVPADPASAAAATRAAAAPDPALALAAEGLGRAARPPFCKPLHQALRATAEVHRALPREPAPSYDATAALAPPDAASPPLPPLPALWQQAPAPGRHKSGLPMSDGIFAAPPGATCQSCAYAAPPRGGRRAGTWRCQRTASDDVAGLVIDPRAAACALHQPSLDCQDCGACCRHAYDLVPLVRTEPVVLRYPALIDRRGKQLSIRRDVEQRRCAALAGPPLGPYSCSIYDSRPATCRDFAAGSVSCLEARRRVGWEA